MAWEKPVVFALALLSGSCVSTRKIDVCTLNTTTGSASCARDKKQYKKNIAEMASWKAMSDIDWGTIADRITECNTAGKLPQEDIFRLLEVCELRPSSGQALCVYNNSRELVVIGYTNGMVATDESGIRKIQQKLAFCMRKK